MTTQKKSGRSKKTRRKSKKDGLSQGMRILLASAFLISFVALSLVLLVNLRGRLLADPTFVFEEPTYEVQHHKPHTYGDVEKLIENQLLNGPQSMGWRRLPAEDGVQIRRIFGDFPTTHFLTELEDHIHQTEAMAHLQIQRQRGLISLFWGDEKRLELRYRIPDDKPVKEARIAIIMDDMGGSMTLFKRLLGIDLPVTPSILPGLNYAQSGAQLMKQSGREYMIHIPMQPRSYPRTNPGDDALLLGQSEEEIRRRVRSYIEAVPGAVGGNNHMGSRFTEETGPMRVVLDELMKHDQFFIDSRTIGSSVAFVEARKMGMKTATRNIFLDNRADVDYIRQQIRKMVRMAHSGREIVAICHPYKQTLEALQLEQEWLKKQPVDFVAASKVVHVY